jgi:hypothetical protein
MAIADDIFPESSANCVADDSTGTTSFDDVFSSTQSISGWNAMNAQFEDDVFFQEMKHTDVNPNRTWSARMGSGGAIYSDSTPGLGEVLPPLKHDKGPFQDEVWQVVMVDNSLNAPYNPATQDYAEDKKYFIHQAGVYQKDTGPGDILDTKPFYSPSVAKHCSGRQCTFAAWGQHAHVPTDWKSSCIYYTRYRDCGDGVMEVTYAIHNYDAKSNSASGDVFNYQNIPWGGVRTTTLRDAHLAPSNGGPAALIHPQPAFGDAVESANIPFIHQTGGYTTFAERVPWPAPAAFVYPGTAEGTPATYTTTGTWAESPGHTTSWNRYTVRVSIQAPGYELPIDHGCRGCALTLTNAANGLSADIGGLMFYYKSGRFYIWPATGVTAADFNAVFAPGSTIGISNTPSPSKPIEDNLALAFVYGKNKEYTSGSGSSYFSGASYGGKARVRTGVTNQAYEGGRDYTVFTINWFAPIKPGYTYYNRQYIISDRFADMDAVASSWQGEAKQGMFFPGDTFPSERTVSKRTFSRRAAALLCRLTFLHGSAPFRSGLHFL